MWYRKVYGQSNRDGSRSFLVLGPGGVLLVKGWRLFVAVIVLFLPFAIPLPLPALIPLLFVWWAILAALVQRARQVQGTAKRS